jgi:hypothetical protein
MSFYEKYLKYKQKYIQLKTEYGLGQTPGARIKEKHNSWIGGSNVTFDLISMKMRNKVL